MSRLPAPATAFLVDKKGIVHGTHVFLDGANTQKSVDHINPCVYATSGFKYTLEEPGSEDYMTHIEKLFETETNYARTTNSRD